MSQLTTLGKPSEYTVTCIVTQKNEQNHTQRVPAPEAYTEPVPRVSFWFQTVGSGATRIWAVHCLLLQEKGARSLDYEFTLTPHGQPWCEIQGQVNGNPFVHYACGGQKVTLLSVPEMSATQAWNQQRDTLQYVVDELKKILLDIGAEMTATSGPLSLQGCMMCEQESSGHTSASWEFGSHG